MKRKRIKDRSRFLKCTVAVPNWPHRAHLRRVERLPQRKPLPPKAKARRKTSQKSLMLLRLNNVVLRKNRPQKRPE